jgi:hypothetical protein
MRLGGGNVNAHLCQRHGRNATFIRFFHEAVDESTSRGDEGETDTTREEGGGWRGLKPESTTGMKDCW